MPQGPMSQLPAVCPAHDTIYRSSIHSVHAPTQWKTTLHCNVVSHWLGTYTKWPLRMQYSYQRRDPYNFNISFQRFIIYLQGLKHRKIVIPRGVCILTSLKMLKNIWESFRHQLTSLHIIVLTHWGLDKISDNLQIITFSWKNLFIYLFLFI